MEADTFQSSLPSIRQLSVVTAPDWAAAPSPTPLCLVQERGSHAFGSRAGLAQLQPQGLVQGGARDLKLDQ